MLQRLKDWLALTTTERRVLLFLVVTLIIGAGIKLWQETFPPGGAHDYRRADSTFAALSEALEANTGTASASGEALPLNINEATKNQLMALPGIGEVLAERILLYREDVGEFRSVDELLKVKGISKKKLEQFKSLITVH